MPNTLPNFKAEFFKALAHPVRIRILDALRDGERNVGELQARLGLDQSAVSQQLAVLRGKGLVSVRKTGTSAYYHVADPLLFDLLDTARAIFNNHLVDTQRLLSQLSDETEALAARGEEAIAPC